AQRQVHHGQDLHFAVHRHGAVGDVVQTQDAGLGRVDDGRGHHGAVDTAVADGEGATGEFIHGNGVFLCPGPQVGDGLLHLGEGQPLRAANHRDHKPLAAPHGDADVVVILVDHVVATNFRI